MALTRITNGSLADPEIVNNNFEYLEELVTDASSKIYSNNAGLESLIASQVSTLTNNLNNKTSELNSTLDSKTSKMENTINALSAKLSTVLSALTPDYSKAVRITTNSTYTATSVGWVYWTGSTGQGPVYLSINGVNRISAGALSSEDAINVVIPILVNKGDRIVPTGNSDSYLGTFFYPCRGLS